MGDLVQGHFGRSGVPSLMGRHDVIRANFKTGKITSVNRQHVPWIHSSPTGRAISGGMRATGRGVKATANNARHNFGLYHLALTARTANNYVYGRKHGLSRGKAALASGTGATLALATHHASRAAHVGFAGALATDIGGFVGQDLITHQLTRHSKRNIAPKRGKSAKGRF